MSNMTLVDACANAAVDAVTARVNGGKLEIYTAARALLLATLDLNATAFAAAASRSAEINEVDPVTADEAGTAAVAVFLNDSDVEQFSGNVTTTGGGGLVTFNTLAWLADDDVAITGGTISYPA